MRTVCPSSKHAFWLSLDQCSPWSFASWPSHIGSADWNSFFCSPALWYSVPLVHHLYPFPTFCLCSGLGNTKFYLVVCGAFLSLLFKKSIAACYFSKHERRISFFLLFSPAYSNKNGCGAKREQCLCLACVKEVTVFQSLHEKCTGSKGCCLSHCMCPCVVAESTDCSIIDKNNVFSSCAASSWFHSSSQICFQLSWFICYVSTGKIELGISDDSLI